MSFTERDERESLSQKKLKILQDNSMSEKSIQEQPVINKKIVKSGHNSKGQFNLQVLPQERNERITANST
jgi:hypothetical protein